MWVKPSDSKELMDRWVQWWNTKEPLELTNAFSSHVISFRLLLFNQAFKVRISLTNPKYTKILGQMIVSPSSNFLSNSVYLKTA